MFVNWSIENGSLYQAGIVNGDVIHAIEGDPTTSMKALDSIIARRNVGDVVRVDVTQRGERKMIPMMLRGSPRLRLATYARAGLPVTDEIHAFRRAWLGSKVGEAESR